MLTDAQIAALKPGDELWDLAENDVKRANAEVAFDKYELVGEDNDTWHVRAIPADDFEYRD